MWRERTRAAEMIKTVHKLKRAQEDWAYCCGVVSLDRARGAPERAMGIQNISVVGPSRVQTVYMHNLDFLSRTLQCWGTIQPRGSYFTRI
jgi:hypothetical protein